MKVSTWRGLNLYISETMPFNCNEFWKYVVKGWLCLQEKNEVVQRKDQKVIFQVFLKSSHVLALCCTSVFESKSRLSVKWMTHYSTHSVLVSQSIFFQLKDDSYVCMYASNVCCKYVQPLMKWIRTDKFLRNPCLISNCLQWSLGHLNHGYDDERGDYTTVVHDHFGYRYEVLSVLGRGSFGQVLKCYDYKLHTLVALKIIRNKKRFHHQALVEVKVLEMLKHRDADDSSNVVHMRGSFYFRNHLCITFELMSINLYELIKQNNFQVRLVAQHLL